MFPPQNDAPSDSFLTTPWSLLAAIARPDDCTPADDAFIASCEICWRPICNFFEGHGYECADARKIARRFLAWLIEHRRATHPDSMHLPLRTYVHDQLKQFLAAEAALTKRVETQFYA